MNILKALLAAASAAFFIASAQAQQSGSVTNHAFVIGKGAGVSGYTSLLCGSAQLAVGQSSADPICRTLTGDVTLSAAGVTAIGTAKVTLAMLTTGTQDTVLGYFSSTTASAATLSNCSTALTYSTSTHTFGCATAPGGQTYATRTAAIAATIPSATTEIVTGGYTTEGDGGGGTYIKVGVLCSGVGCFTSADGAFWKLDFSNGINCAQFGATPAGVGGADQSTAFSACVAFYNANTSSPYTQKITVNGGIYAFDARITTFSVIASMEGQCSSAQPTIFYKRYVEADADLGLISMTTHGGLIRCLQGAGSGGSGGSFISAKLPNNAANVGILRIENVNSSAGDTFRQGLLIDGCTATSAPIGYRNFWVSNSQFFGAFNTAVGIRCAHHGFLTGNSFANTGGTSTIALSLTGTVGVPSFDVHYHGGIIAGDLSLDGVTSSSVAGWISGSITNTATVDLFNIFGDVTGTVQHNWTNSGIYNSTTIDGTITVAAASSMSFPTSGLKIRDSDASHAMSIAVGSNLTANRTFTLTTGDANRTLDISAANVTIAANPATWLATPSSANLAAALTDETGTGAAVFANTPALVTPDIGAATGTSLKINSTMTAKVAVDLAGGDIFAWRFSSSLPRGTFGVTAGGGDPYNCYNTVFSSGNVVNFDKTGAAGCIGATTVGFGFWSATGTTGNTAFDFSSAVPSLMIRTSGGISTGSKSSTITISDGEFGLSKITASGTSPGANSCKVSAVAGTSAGTCKLIAYCGTSTTAATILDNIGGGC